MVDTVRNRIESGVDVAQKDPRKQRAGQAWRVRTGLHRQNKGETGGVLKCIPR